MKKLISNPLVRAILLLIVLILGLLFSVQAQNVRSGDRVQFSIKGDSLIVKSENLMPMVRYNFEFHFKNKPPVSMTYVPNKFKGDIAIKISESAMIPLKSYYVTKIEITDPMRNKQTVTNLTDGFYFIKKL